MASVEEVKKAQELLRVRAAQEKLKSSPVEELGTRFMQGVNTGIAQGVGAPVDLTTAGINFLLNTPLEAGQRGKGKTIGDLAGIPNITDPVGGSKQIQEIGAALGFNYADISEVPERVRPIARAGEAVGASVPAAAVPFAAAARAGTTPVTGPFRSFIEPARTAPMTTAGIEAAAAGGAGMGAGVAEEMFPGSPLARMTGELGGAFLSPLSIFAKTTRRLTGGLMETARKARESFSAAAIEQGAARHVQELATTFGEDPQKIARALREGGEIPMGSGAKSQSLAIQALERKLMRNSHFFGIEVQRDLKATIDKLNFAFREAAGSGDPQALRNLAAARKEYARTLIDANMNLAERRIMEARESIVPGSSTNAGTNRRAKEVILESLGEARAYEKSLWAEVPRDVRIDPATFRTKYETEVTAGLLPGEKVDLPPAIEAEIKRLTKSPKLPTSGELLRLRSRVLNEIRKEAGAQAPDRDRIHRLRIIEDSILDDLGALEGAAEARAFSRDLNDRFTRGYAGKVLGLDPKGGERVPGELTLEGLRGRGQSRVSQDLESAAGSRVQEMRELESEMLRDMASSTIDPMTGQINPRALERFRQANKEVLANFPELDRVFSDAAATTSIYGKRIKRIMQRDKALQEHSAFARVLSSEDPMRVMRAALNGPNPVSDMDRIFLLARKDPKAAAGAKRTLIDLLLNESASKVNLPDGEVMLVSGGRLRELMEAGDGGVLAAAKKSGILSKGDVGRLNTIADEATKIESAMRFPGELDKIVKDPSMLTDLLARLVGANLGSHSLIAKGSGAQLVMAHAGSRAVRRLVEKLPAQNITRVLESAVRDPELMAMLLTKNVPQGRMQKLAAKLEKKLRDEGVLYQVSEAWRPPVGPIGAASTELPEIMERER